MTERRCPCCRKTFLPLGCQPEQTVCSESACQRQRQADYRRKKLATDPNYSEACRQSARHWRKEHPDYWKQYRRRRPDSRERNRQQQKSRDRKRRLQNLANNISAADLRLCPATVWLLGPALTDLANNISAPVQVWVLEALPLSGPVAHHLANNTPLAP
jgi:hypothetical protein